MTIKKTPSTPEFAFICNAIAASSKGIMAAFENMRGESALLVAETPQQYIVGERYTLEMRPYQYPDAPALPAFGFRGAPKTEAEPDV